MTADVLLRMVVAQRAALEAMLAQNEALLAAIEGDAAPSPVPAPEFPAVDGCTHPAEKRQDTTVGGGSSRSFFCSGCRRTSDELKEIR